MKKTIFILTIIAVLAIALYKWLTNGDENNEETVQETTTEEVKEPASEKEEKVNGNKAEEAKTEDKVESHK